MSAVCNVAEQPDRAVRSVRLLWHPNHLLRSFDWRSGDMDLLNGGSEAASLK